MKVKEIEGLIDFIAKSGLEEVNIETEQIKLAVKRNVPIVQQVSPPAPSVSTSSGASQATLSADDTASSEPLPNKYVEFKAPMIGTLYHAPSPEASPFVQVGDQIKRPKIMCY